VVWGDRTVPAAGLHRGGLTNRDCRGSAGLGGGRDYVIAVWLTATLTVVAEVSSVGPSVPPSSAAEKVAGVVFERGCAPSPRVSIPPLLKLALWSVMTRSAFRLPVPPRW